ncbi:MAG: hypothetical protein S4CHLAM45_04290 [Chlamydiales bacterium]|nr:hypothetical protein [Chlamydiales bacterium]MCH9619283.1 hypothetical protein [Chlamydiales bacterium]MCH9622545.1 hypothetical protein [Chlamydiales bacterium]
MTNTSGSTDYSLSCFGEYCDDLVSCLELLDSFEKGEVSLFTFEYKILIAALNVDCLYADEPMGAVINDFFEKKGTFGENFNPQERRDFVKTFFPSFKTKVKEAFEKRIQFQTTEIKPIPLELINESWIYCPECVNGFNGEEDKFLFTKLSNEKSFFVYCPKCFLPMESKENLSQDLCLSHHYLGIFLDQKHLKVVAKL